MPNFNFLGFRLPCKSSMALLKLIVCLPDTCPFFFVSSSVIPFRTFITESHFLIYSSNFFFSDPASGFLSFAASIDISNAFTTFFKNVYLPNCFFATMGLFCFHRTIIVALASFCICVFLFSFLGIIKMGSGCCP